MGRVLMAVSIRISELMVQFESGKERRKCHQAQRQRRNEKEKRMSGFHASH
jgi:hypothetical protein